MQEAEGSLPSMLLQQRPIERLSPEMRRQIDVFSSRPVEQFESPV